MEHISSNQFLRAYIQKCGVPLWEIGEEMKLSESDLSRLLQGKLSPYQSQQIITIANRLVTKSRTVDELNDGWQED